MTESMSTTDLMHILDTGDTVRHLPSGEKWEVAYVDGADLAWIGWPEGTAKIADCELVEKASQEKYIRTLEMMASSRHEGDSRVRYARRILRSLAPRPLTFMVHRWCQGNYEPLREDIQAFSQMMERILRVNARKGGYDECEPHWLLAKLTEEVGELGQWLAAEMYRPWGSTVIQSDPDSHNRVIDHAIHECVDIANVAMMMASVLADRIVEVEE